MEREKKRWKRRKNDKNMITYKEAIKQSMEMLAQDKKRVFLGYNVKFGSKAYGTLIDIPKSKLIETPIAENLMIGLVTGMSLEGYLPVVFFERHDFMLNALDGIINHLDKLESMSEGQYKTKVIIRAAIGSKKPLDAGVQHTQDFSKAFKKMIKFPIYEPKTSKEVIEAYLLAKKSSTPVMIIERKDLYDIEFV